MSDDYSILLTIDVEDWFQVENFKRCIPFSSWADRELRVESNTYRILDLLDSTARCSATFFVLGWIAERLPHLIREIHVRGHEVASHGYYHNLCYHDGLNDLKRDLTDSKFLLEDIIGSSVDGYRAPSFSINDEILKIIEESGYAYDSSFNSFAMHGRYGKIDLGKNGRKGIASRISNTFYELPISNFRFGNQILPWGGGGYFRLIPFFIFKQGVKAILRKDGAFLLYLHPWEVDPLQPRVNDAPTIFKLRHYMNLNKTESKLVSVIRAFSKYSFLTCRQYLNKCHGFFEHNKDNTN
jgi:polysaccharide deacetylase family protein (PEP-CTERM system associated)